MSTIWRRRTRNSSSSCGFLGGAEWPRLRSNGLSEEGQDSGVDSGPSLPIPSHRFREIPHLTGVHGSNRDCNPLPAQRPAHRLSCPPVASSTTSVGALSLKCSISCCMPSSQFGTDQLYLAGVTDGDVQHRLRDVDTYVNLHWSSSLPCHAFRCSGRPGRGSCLANTSSRLAHLYELIGQTPARRPSLTPSVFAT